MNVLNSLVFSSKGTKVVLKATVGHFSTITELAPCYWFASASLANPYCQSMWISVGSRALA